MDPRIENLKSTTFFGKRLRRRQIADIQTTVSLGAGLLWQNRTEEFQALTSGSKGDAGDLL